MRFFVSVSQRFTREERAASMVEFAIVVPLLLLLVFGIIDFGRVFFDLNNLTNVAREGARNGAVLPTAGTTELNSIRDAVIARFNQNSMKNSALTTAMVTVTAQGTSPNRTIRVVITGYPLNPIVPIGPLTGPLRDVRAEFRHEFQ
jgi:Flp pilus assembly protein TadG